MEGLAVALLAKVFAGRWPEHPLQRFGAPTGKEDACIRAGAKQQRTNQRREMAKLEGLFASERPNHDAVCNYYSVGGKVLAETYLGAFKRRLHVPL